MQGAIVDDFVSSAHWLVHLASRVDAADWEQPGLGVWDVRSLLGHAARALVTTKDYIGRPADHVDVPSALAYLLGSSKADPAAIAARGIESGRELGDNPAAAVSELAGIVIDLVKATDENVMLSTIAGGMTLEAYLPTRTVELIVHGCDLARAVGVEPTPPKPATASVARLLTEAFIGTGRAAALCLVLAGRLVNDDDLVLWPSKQTS